MRSLRCSSPRRSAPCRLLRNRPRIRARARRSRRSAAGLRLAPKPTDRATPRHSPLRCSRPAASASRSISTPISASRKVGDIVTVIISINDKATFGNSTRSLDDREDRILHSTGLFTPPCNSARPRRPTRLTFNHDVNSTSTAQGQGNIDRSEQIQLSVPAVVTQVLPNGNLMISGSQEVRVNFELRQLTVAGIVRPADISRNNTIAYDRVAEARISYGGRGPAHRSAAAGLGSADLRSLKPF